jgi:four helix bundle protein
MVWPSNFDHEKLDVYQLELKFLTWVTQFLADLSGPLSTPTRELREQLDRASLSVLLNTAEGNGRRQGRQRAKFFDDARGSAIECAACLDASVAKGFALLERIQPGKEMLVRIVAMLTKLVERFDPYQYRVRDGAQALTEPLEDEDDDEHEAAVATLWRALERGWPRRRPCEVGTIDKVSKAIVGKILAGEWAAVGSDLRADRQNCSP